LQRVSNCCRGDSRGFHSRSQSALCSSHSGNQIDHGIAGCAASAVAATAATANQDFPRNVLAPQTGAVQSVSIKPKPLAPITVAPSTPPGFVGPVQPPPPRTPPTVITSAAPPPAPAALPADVLVWDADSKTVDVKEGEMSAKFTFYFTNVSHSEVSITALRPSCGCTAAKLPETPWKIAPGQSGPISAEMNVQGAYGFKTKGLTVETTSGNKFLTLMAKLPAAPPTPAVASVPGAPMVQRTEAERAKNLQSALSDRQAPLKGDCAKCHVEPATGKHGKELYVAACGICHNAERRASMVVDLQERVKTNSVPYPPEYWNMFVTMGKPGTLMPAFAKEHGGFMTPDQVTSLVDYLAKDFPKEEKIVYKETSMGHAGTPTPVISSPVTIPAQPSQIPTPKPASTNVTTSAAASLLPSALGTFPAPANH